MTRFEEESVSILGMARGGAISRIDAEVTSAVPNRPVVVLVRDFNQVNYRHIRLLQDRRLALLRRLASDDGRSYPKENGGEKSR